MKTLRRVGLAGLAALAACTSSEPIVVEDTAGLLTHEQRTHLSRVHAFLRNDFDLDYRVHVARNADAIETYAARRFEALDIGSLSRSSRGLLLVVDTGSDRVRLEVGYGLEGVLTDAFVAYLEQRQMVPFFRERRVADGILATTELIVDRLQRTAGEAWLDSGMAGSGGGGATTAARLGAGPDLTFRRTTASAAAGDDPGSTLEAYLQAMAARNARPDLPIYTRATRAMLAGWTMTPAQMDNVVRTYRGCDPEAPRYDDTGRRAVIRYPIPQRSCAPWFLQREEGRWRLDLTVLQNVVRFGRSNAWHFAPGVGHPYAFAFTDWRFDGHGFPQG